MKKYTFLLLFLLIIGCTSTKNIPNSISYIEPKNVTNIATIRGLYDTKIGVFNHPALYVYSVDGRLIKNAEKSWNNDLKIETGIRQIGIEYLYGSFNARANITINVKDGSSYQIQYIPPSSVFNYQGGSIDVWIEDKSNNKVVSKVIRTPIISPTISPYPIYIYR
jgi:hypothetical protein